MSSETITRNDLENILNEVLPSVSVDYIVEKGTTGKWRYRKWSSGFYEAWYSSGKTSVTTTTSSGNGWYRNSSAYEISCPSIGINDIAHVNINVQTAYAYTMSSVVTANSTKLEYYVGHLGSLSSVDAWVSAYICGTYT